MDLGQFSRQEEATGRAGCRDEPPHRGHRGGGGHLGLPQAATLEASLQCAGNRTHGATTSTDQHCQ